MISPVTGLVPTRLILDQTIGAEIVLLITEPSSRARDFEGRDLTGFHVKSGLVETSYGPIFFLLYYFPDPATGEHIIYENAVNPKDARHLGIFEELASQTHWHVVIADEDRNVVNAFEFVNRYGLAEALPQIRKACATMSVLDFKRAKAEFQKTYTIDELMKA